MRIVQFDENVNSGKLETACRKQGLVEPYRFPSRLMGHPDEEVLPALLPRNNLILTNDRGFVHDHLDYLPDTHAGILIVEQDDDAPSEMTMNRLIAILADFKAKFPQWHCSPWGNSVVLLSPSFLQVFRVVSHRLVPNGEAIERSANDWQDKFTRMLSQNAAGVPLLNSGGNNGNSSVP